MAAAGHHRTARRVANGSCGAPLQILGTLHTGWRRSRTRRPANNQETVFSPQAGTVEIVENGFSRWPVAHKPQMYKRGCERFFPGRQERAAPSGPGLPVTGRLYVRLFTEAALSGINQVMFLGKLNG